MVFHKHNKTLSSSIFETMIVTDYENNNYHHESGEFSAEYLQYHAFGGHIDLLRCGFIPFFIPLAVLLNKEYLNGKDSSIFVIILLLDENELYHDAAL